MTTADTRTAEHGAKETPDAAETGRTLSSIRLISPQETPTQEDMRIGARVVRFAERAEPGHVRTEMPCCPLGDAAEHPRREARGILLPTEPQTLVTHAVCPACRWLWRFRVVSEGRGRFAVWFDLVEMLAVAERTRSYTPRF